MASNDEISSFDGWVKIRTLGKGAFGRVTLWRNQITDEAIAIKQCCVQLTTITKQRWKEEIHMLKTNQHPNLVAVRGIPDGLEEALNSDEPCLGMELCEGGDLRKVLNQAANCTGLNELAVLNILRDIASAVCFLHSHKIIHRDIKPENILLSYIGDKVVYKITDLGYAKHLDQSSVANSFVGTMKYVAPEIYESNDGYTITADYWSFGNVIFECITGHRPFDFDMCFVKWHSLLREKKSADICGFTNEGSIEFGSEIPSPHKLSSPLIPMFEEWLRLTLEWKASLRGGEKDENGLRHRFRSIIDKILETKVIHVFCVTDCKLLSFAVEESNTVLELQDKIGQQCSFRPDELILPNGETLRSEGSILQWYNQTGDSEWLFYCINAESLLERRYRTSNVTKDLPNSFKRIMQAPEQKINLSELKRMWGLSLNFCSELARNYRRLLQAQRAVMITLRNCNSRLMQEKEVMTAEAHKLNASLEMFIESCEYDLQLFRQTGFDSNLANIRYKEEILRMIEEGRKYQENLIEELCRKVTKAQRDLVNLKNSSLLSTKETALDQITKLAKDQYEKLDEIDAAQKTDSRDMVNIILQVVSKWERIESVFYTHLGEVTLCKSTMQTLLPDITDVITKLQEYRQHLHEMMRRKQEMTWKCLTLGRMTPSASMSSGYSSMTNTLSSLIEDTEHGSGSAAVVKETEQRLQRLGSLLKSLSSPSSQPAGCTRRISAGAVLTTFPEETVSDLEFTPKQRASEPPDFSSVNW